MSGTAARAMRLATWGGIALVAPFLVLAGLFTWLLFQDVRVLTPLVGLLAITWLGALLAGWLAARREASRLDGLAAGSGELPVTPEEQPELWELVLEAARLADGPIPQELRLTAAARVTARQRDRLVLDIGVPLLFVLDPPALGALVARALSEAQGGWADVAERVDRLRAFADQMARRRLTRPLAEGVHRRISAARSEGLLEADDVAARVAGPRTAARALALALLVRSATGWWREEFLVPELSSHQPPRPLLQGLESLLGDPVRQQQLERAARGRLPADDGRGVPGIEARVHSLRVGVDGPPERIDAPAAELVRTPSTVLDRLGEAVLGTTGWDRTWPEALEAWGARTSHCCAVLLTSDDPGTDRLGAVLDGVAAGALPNRVRELTRDPRADTTGLGAFLLTGLLAAALVAGGAGRLSPSWSGEIDVVSPDGEPLEVPRAARLVVEEPALVQDLRRILVELGASLDFVPGATDAETGVPLQAFLRRQGRRRLPGTGFPAPEEHS